MTIFNTVTKKNYTVDDVLTVDGKNVYFTVDGFCFPEEVIQLPTIEEIKEDFNIDDTVRNYVDKIWGCSDYSERQKTMRLKEKLKHFSLLMKIKLFGKKLRFWYENNQIHRECCDNWNKRKIILKTRNKVWFYTVSPL